MTRGAHGQALPETLRLVESWRTFEGQGFQSRRKFRSGPHPHSPQPLSQRRDREAVGDGSGTRPPRVVTVRPLRASSSGRDRLSTPPQGRVPVRTKLECPLESGAGTARLTKRSRIVTCGNYIIKIERNAAGVFAFDRPERDCVQKSCSAMRGVDPCAGMTCMELEALSRIVEEECIGVAREAGVIMWPTATALEPWDQDGIQVEFNELSRNLVKNEPHIFLGLVESRNVYEK